MHRCLPDALEDKELLLGELLSKEGLGLFAVWAPGLGEDGDLVGGDRVLEGPIG